MAYKEYYNQFGLQNPNHYFRRVVRDSSGEGQYLDASRNLEKIFANPAKYSRQEIKDAYGKVLFRPGTEEKGDTSGPYYDRRGGDLNDEYVFNDNRFKTAQNRYDIGLQDLLLQARSTAPAPAPKATPVSKPAPASGPTAFDKRLGTIKAKNEADTASLSKSIKTQNKQYAAAAASNKNDSIIESLQKQITGWNTKYNNLVTSNKDTVKSLKTDYSNTINSLKGGYDNQIKDLLAGFDTKYSGLESNYNDKINNLKTGYDTTLGNLTSGFNNQINSLTAGFNTKIGDLTNSYDSKIADYGRQVDGLNKQIESYQKSYNPTTVVGSTAKATSFEVPESTAGQLGIKNKGTSQFNRKERNNLKITGVQL